MQMEHIDREAEEWMRQALCRGMPSNLFFPTSGANTNLKEARIVCAVCVVRAECLQYALRIRAEAGIFAGTTPNDREKLRKHDDA